MEKIYTKNKYTLQWETHPKHTFKSLCSLMEHQSLVDIVICCGNNTLHAHKCILAAGSPYFRDELEKNSSIEQIVMNGFDFAVMKAIIEFMYCGETIISEEHIKYLIAAAKLFQMRGLDILFSDRQEYQHLADDVYIPYPQFITSKPKYPMAYHPFNNTPITSNILKPINYNMSESYNQRKLKRKYIRSEAEKACAKEAQASRMALAHLQKEIASTPQVNSFIIEESCTETTVENFIPHTDDNFVENLNGIQQVQVVNYSDPDNNLYNTSNSFLEDTKPPNLLHFATKSGVQHPQELTADKIKHILGTDIPSNVEIMFKTSEGNFVTVTDEVLQNISKGGLQYQVVDENGHVGEVQDLKVLERVASEKLDRQQSADMIKELIKMSKLNGSNATTILCGNDPLRVTKSEEFINSKFSIPISSENSQNAQNGNHSCKQDPQDICNFDLNNEELFKNKCEITDSKPVEFVLLNDPEFGGESIITASPTKLNFYTGENLLNPNVLPLNKNAGHNINQDSLNDSLMEVSIKRSPKKSKSSLKFSPDMFFADLETCSATENDEGVDNKHDTKKLPPLRKK